MNEKPSPANIISLFEQFEATVTNTAPIIGNYYLNLRQNGIPPELAEQLVMDWHHIFWTCQFPEKRPDANE